MNFHANDFQFNDDGYCSVLAFAASGSVDEMNYLVLQITNNPSSQDMRLHQEGIHLELGEIGVSGYDLVDKLELVGNNLLLRLGNKTPKSILDKTISIYLPLSLVENSEFVHAVHLFRNRLMTTKRERQGS